MAFRTMMVGNFGLLIMTNVFFKYCVVFNHGKRKLDLHLGGIQTWSGPLSKIKSVLKIQGDL
jgi:hypothetical protein